MKELLTKLNDRILRFDGVSIIEANQVQDLLLRGAKPAQLRVLVETPEVLQFNQNVADTDRLQEFMVQPINFKFDWKLPREYLSLDVDQHVSEVFGERLAGLKYDSAQCDAAITRVALELQGFRARGLYDLLRVIIYVLHRFRETGQVWGVGRGSSCASYILFLLGLHVVDPIVFDVPLEEFMHD